MLNLSVVAAGDRVLITMPRLPGCDVVRNKNPLCLALIDVALAHWVGVVADLSGFAPFYEGAVPLCPGSWCKRGALRVLMLTFLGLKLGLSV